MREEVLNQSNEPTTNVTVDGRDYKIEKLSEIIRQQFVSAVAVGEGIRRTQMRLALFQTARKAYAAPLNTALAEEL